MLRDRIVRDINNTQTQKHLLAKKNLKFTKVKEIPLALESAVHGTRDIQTPSNDTVHKVADSKELNGYKCYRCGKTNYNVDTRILCVTNVTKQATWLWYVKVHKKDTDTSFKFFDYKESAICTHTVTEQSPSEEKEEYSLFTIHDIKWYGKQNISPVCYCELKISTEFDTGSAVTIMAESMQVQRDFIRFPAKVSSKFVYIPGSER